MRELLRRAGRLLLRLAGSPAPAPERPGGPPAHWLERVRAGAPDLLARIDLADPEPAVRPARPEPRPRPSVVSKGRRRRAAESREAVPSPPDARPAPPPADRRNPPPAPPAAPRRDPESPVRRVLRHVVRPAATAPAEPARPRPAAAEPATARPPASRAPLVPDVPAAAPRPRHPVPQTQPQRAAAPPRPQPEHRVAPRPRPEPPAFPARPRARIDEPAATTTLPHRATAPAELEFPEETTGRWPSLPEPPEPAADPVRLALREAEARARLDREQRGEPWSA